ncbi:Crp/Fnr family transcriptional regulator [Methylomonas sp. UP202]|nr:Crp/Fnr family transcriptional regulator [Methylomonas sp. UP202]WGS88207.1 Crp/Fnr family transcriptional regulator [Methylomonas sp. UP202]
MTTLNSQRINLLLGALPAQTYQRLATDLEPIQMPAGQVIYESGSELRYAYFPTTCIVSKIYVIADGASSELAIIGNEGFVGLSLLMGGRTMPHQAVVSTAGYGYRLRRQRFIEEIASAGRTLNDNSLLHLLLRYTQALMTQINQAAACNRHHSIHQQLCRWLLLTLDRQASNEMLATHDHIANMLGVRRESITDAAGKLQQKGLINYSRGRLVVLSRAGLEEQVCECYDVINAEFTRLIPAFVNKPASRGLPPIASAKATKRPVHDLVFE